MNKEQLSRVSAWFRAKPGRIAALRAADAFCTGATAGAFLSVLAVRAWRRDPAALRLALTCGVSFLALTAVRARLNRPRPYEVYGMEPLIEKDTRGRSFPSRHVFSGCVIGTSLLFLVPWLGAAVLGLACLLAAVRVLAGVHFPRDVLAGAVCGVLSALVGFQLIP